MSNIDIKQGDILMCNLVNNVDNEQMGIRPCVCISADIRNENSPNVFIFPITHSNKKHQPCHYILYKEDYPFFRYKNNTVLCEEGRSISKKRVQRKIGAINEKDINQILKCKEFVFIEKTS